ncbi:MAG: leucine-rich repeat protein, partial [Kiritimatiellae bacterium]|nr:leucine-rich repeat protein [Kiritimatiellia bacterium]
MKIKTILAVLSLSALSCVTAFAEPPSIPSGGDGPGSGGTEGPGGGGPSGGGGGGGSFTYDSFISVTTNAYCLVREGVLFGYTSSLSTSVAPTAAAGVTELAHGVFAGNTSITTVNLENTSITEIPSDCFAGCTALKTVTLPSTCTSIGPGAFAGCTALATC